MLSCAFACPKFQFHPGHLFFILCVPIGNTIRVRISCATLIRSTFKDGAGRNVNIVSYANEASNMILLRLEFSHAVAEQQIHRMRVHAKTYLRNHNLVRTRSCIHWFGSFVIPQRFRLVDETTHPTQSLSKNCIHIVKCGPTAQTFQRSSRA